MGIEAESNGSGGPSRGWNLGTFDAFVERGLRCVISISGFVAGGVGRHVIARELPEVPRPNPCRTVSPHGRG